jgi:4-hydroxybenzoate polyprenyltransferase
MNRSFTNYINLTRINRPIGIGLLFLPCLFGIFLSEKKVQIDFTKIFWLILLFAAGAAIMRSAGCIINDIFDQKFDRQVARTKNRPIASGQISQKQALIFLAFLLLAGLVILLQFNSITILSGFIAVALAGTYPLMKRITYYPQIFLGLAFNFGILMASLAITNRINLSCVILYCAAIIWTLIYDTIYAYQDIEDDLKIGVKSSAIKFRKNPKRILLILSLAMFVLLFFTGLLESLNWHFFITIGAAFLFSAQKIINCNFSDPKNCLKVFKENFWIGSLISIGIFLG